MREFKITIANLGLLNEGKVREAEISFPIDGDELEEIYNYVTFDGENDYIITSGEGDFVPDQFEFLENFMKIEDMNDEEYEIFLAICKNEGSGEAFEIYDKYEYRVWEGVKDWSDIAYQMVTERYEWNELPDVFKVHFNFESYGEELESVTNGYWNPDRKVYVESW